MYVSKTHEHIVWALAYTFLSFADIHAACFFFRCDGVNPQLAQMPVPVRGWPARPGEVPLAQAVGSAAAPRSFWPDEVPLAQAVGFAAAPRSQAAPSGMAARPPFT